MAYLGHNLDGLSSGPTRITELTSRSSDGHSNSPQLSAGRTGWRLCYCQRLLLWVLPHCGGRSPSCTPQAPIGSVASSVGSVQAPGFLVQGHAPVGLVTALGLVLRMPLVKCCLDMTRGSASTLHPSGLLRGPVTQLRLHSRAERLSPQRWGARPAISVAEQGWGWWTVWKGSHLKLWPLALSHGNGRWALLTKTDSSRQVPGSWPPAGTPFPAPDRVLLCSAEAEWVALRPAPSLLLFTLRALSLQQEAGCLLARCPLQHPSGSAGHGGRMLSKQLDLAHALSCLVRKHSVPQAWGATVCSQ